MWYLLRDIIWHKWRGGVVAVVSLFMVYSAIIENGFPDAGLPTMKDILPVWEWWGWILIALVLLFICAVAYANQQRRQLEHHDNWIIAHKARFGKLPPVPNYLLPAVGNYTVGEPLSKKIEIKRVSHAYLHGLTEENRERLLQLIDWLDKDRHEFLQYMRDTAPPGGSAITHLRPKRKEK